MDDELLRFGSVGRESTVISQHFDELVDLGDDAIGVRAVPRGVISVVVGEYSTKGCFRLKALANRARQ